MQRTCVTFLAASSIDFFKRGISKAIPAVLVALTLLLAFGSVSYAGEADLAIPDLHQGKFSIAGAEISGYTLLFYGAFVIVGTLGTIYAVEGTSESVGLREALHQALTLGGAAALLVFFAFAMQCMSTSAVVRRETGSWKWPAIQWAYMTGLAYACAYLANRLVSLYWS